jgi:uncharacterized protein YdeI (YjbR/CyaY-like superfamily)
MTTEAKVTAYISNHDKWTIGLTILRELLINTELTEDLKWGMPTYRINGRNVVSMSAFKNHFGIWFHNGSFLKDEHNLLENAQEGKTKGMRHIRYNDVKDIDISILKSYILEAIQNQKDGKEIKPTRSKKPLDIPSIMTTHLTAHTLDNLNKLSLAKRNDYIRYIISAKKQETKLNRIQKIIPMIDRGVGINDIYKSKK